MSTVTLVQEEKDVVIVLQENYIPYMISVAMERALPEIDGFKPSHRKLLWTMYEMGLLKGNRTKSANIVGSTMKYNPHGDQAIYETMVRLAQADTLLFKYVDGKGNFGQHTSKSLQFASSRYTEAKMTPICQELFKGINKDAVEFVPSYDGEREEPKLLCPTFPNILVNANMGIAVGMASNICSFNLKEVCEATKEYIKDRNIKISDYLVAPDFATGGIVLYDESDIEKVYNTGRGSIKVRAKYRYNEKENAIEVYEIPYTTTREDIINKIVELIKDGDTKDIKNVDDLTDLKGMNIFIELKKGVNVEKVMNFLFAKTPLQDNFGCNFNILVDDRPRVMGIKSILSSWINFRIDNIRRQAKFDMNKKIADLELLEGLKRILLDIDIVVDIVKNSETDEEVITSLINKFGINIRQAEYVADIKLRNLNKSYILGRTKDIDTLRLEINALNNIIKSDDKIKQIIINQLDLIVKNYSSERKTDVEYGTKSKLIVDEIDNYNVMHFVTRDGFYKKIPLTSLRTSGDHKLKDGDIIVSETQGQNTDDVLVFVDSGNVYRLKAHKIDDCKTSTLGIYLPSELKLTNEKVVKVVPTSYSEGENLAIFYNDGYIARVNIKAYQSNYSILKGSAGRSIVHIEKLTNDIDVMLISTEGKALIFNTNGINTISSRIAKGVKGISLPDGIKLIQVIPNPTSSMNLEIITSKMGTFESKSQSCQYYQGSRGNVGVFLYNCRTKQDTITSLKKL